MTDNNTSSSITWHERAPVKGESEAVILAGADFCPIRRFEQKLLDGEEIFDGIILDYLEDNDFCLVNQEAVICEKNLTAASPSGYGLRCSPAVSNYMKNVKIDAAGLANNHILDFRDEGVMETIKTLEKAGIKTLGAGADIHEAAKPLVVIINGLKICFWAVAERELNIAGENSAGAAPFIPEENTAKISELKKKSDFLIIYVHAGHEFMTTPSPRIRDSYRKFVEAGADLVAGHHPHVVQGIESYKGKWIVYSMGNLVFDSPYVSAYPLTDTGFLSRISVAGGCLSKLEIIPYRIDSGAVVRGLSEEEMKGFMTFLRKSSADITDERKFYFEWETNVRTRWQQDYGRIMAKFSERYQDEEDADFPRRMRNLFTCPTHAEIIEKISYMLEEGKIDRTQPD